MTVTLQNAEAKFVGNGSTSVFPLQIEVVAAADLLVERWVNYVKTTLVLNVDYTVSDLGLETGATVTLSGGPLASGAVLLVKRVTTIIQDKTTAYTNELDPAAVLEQLDRATMIAQELRAQLDRSIKFAFGPVTESYTPNAFFATDSSGQLTLLTSVPSTLNTISGIVVWEGATVASLEADTDLGYSGGAVVPVSIGNIVRAGGFRYQVVSSGAATYDIQTAGGVKVLALDFDSGAFASVSSTTSLTTFLTRAIAAGYGSLAAVTTAITSMSLSGVNKFSLRGTARSILSRAASAGNLLTFTSPTALAVSGLRMDGKFSTAGLSGHGLVLIDPQKSSVDNLITEDFGGYSADNGGAGMLIYPADGSALSKHLILTRLQQFGDPLSEKCFGTIVVGGELSVMGLSTVKNMATNFGLEYKNNSAHNILGMSTGEWCRYSFGFGYEGAYYNTNNVVGLVASKNSDIGLQFSHTKQSIAIGANFHANSHPDSFGSGHAYGFHIEVDSDENIGVGLLASGTAMDYPVRIRSKRNAVQIADYSSAPNAVTIESGAIANFVDLFHIGNRAASMIPIISDLNGVLSGANANVFNCDLTREYYGTVSGYFTWSADQLATPYAHFTTTTFRFEGATGQSILGLSVAIDKQAGLRVATTTQGQEGAWVYDYNASQSYWRIDAGNTQVLRIDPVAVGPVTSGTITLGKNLGAWGDAFVGRLRCAPTTSQITLQNDTMTFTKVSNTQMKLEFKGSDGVVRSTTFTLS